MAAESVRLIDPRRILPNPENPRLIFRQEELDALAESIRRQGILVPLTLYPDGKGFKILDGERRWRCAIKLALTSVPAILVSKPDKMTNLMMMFAIHHRRDEWDPLPTAEKLKVLEQLYAKRYGKAPSERELAELASLKVGEVRRFKKLLALPESYRQMLMLELQKPRADQKITVDHVLEARAGALALRKRDILHNDKEEDSLRTAIIEKFRTGVIDNTVAPRKLAKIARAVERGDVALDVARAAVLKLKNVKTYSIDTTFEDTAADQDEQHAAEILSSRLQEKIESFVKRRLVLAPPLLSSLRQLSKVLAKVK
ncbi:ParB/RepB/Spo0J family partition protein [Luteibacter jiangsuensis]|uniref:ParB/RepB/Spo0J family partition protein n=1 Tax=Luteibacter jiangsuensis TaxID=637577 RepID=A0ABT9T4P4_9GAMM|nr:ParB/RepB/Spo0J family partition protein [Luteibacter jiangsuensis]MDQ0011543.1 ParB/RepB/Spo0J family partition protein [Luteibacter jiangsuensis]